MRAKLGHCLCLGILVLLSGVLTGCGLGSPSSGGENAGAVSGRTERNATFSQAPHTPVPPRLQGRVQDGATEKPLTGARLDAGETRTTSDNEGRFTLDAAPAELRVSHPGYLERQLTQAELKPYLASSDALTATLPITLTPRVLTGTVTEVGSGQPLAGITVTVGERSTQTGPDGRYELAYVEPGQMISLVSEAHRPTNTLTYEGQAQQDVALQPWQVTLTVHEETSQKPLAEAQVSNGMAALAVTNAQGQAVVYAKPAALLSVRLAGYRPVTVTYEGQETLAVTLQPIRLSGELRDAKTDQPLANALVQVYTDAPVPTLLRADAEGRFVIDDAAAVREIAIKMPGYRRHVEPIKQAGTLTLKLEPFEARGIYIPFGLLTLPDYIEALLNLVRDSELNAVVVDVKSDRARLAWPSQHPLALELEAYSPDVMDLKQFLQACHERDIYAIARIVTFKDDLLAKKHPEWAVMRAEGIPYVDLEGLQWVDPFRQEVREYNIALACEIAELGFDEVQFDYLRFPSDGRVKGLTYSQESTLESRTAQMEAFCIEFYEALSVTPAFVSADIFGLTPWVKPPADMGIGQRVMDIAPHVDYLSPMLYPTTFIKGNLDYDAPWLHPYEIVNFSVAKLHQLTPTRIRPWLQHYSIYGINYGPVELLKQRKGAEDADSCGWLFWNAGGKYEPEIFQPGVYDRYPAVRDYKPAQ